MNKSDVIKAIIAASLALNIEPNTDGTVEELKARLKQLEERKAEQDAEQAGGELGGEESTTDAVSLSTDLAEGNDLSKETPAEKPSIETQGKTGGGPTQPDPKVRTGGGPTQPDPKARTGGGPTQPDPKSQQPVVLISNTTIETVNKQGDKLRMVKGQEKTFNADDAAVLVALPYVSVV